MQLGSSGDTIPDSAEISMVSPEFCYVLARNSGILMQFGQGRFVKYALKSNNNVKRIVSMCMTYIIV